MFSQISHTASHAVNRKVSIRALISGLVSLCVPHAIILVVALAVIFSLQSHSFWTWPHVGKEVGKPHPAFIDQNPTTAVMLPHFAIGIGTSLNHVVPSNVFLASTVIAGVAMAEIGFRYLLKASARFRVSVGEGISPYLLLISAFALTQIIMLRRSSARSAHWRISNYFKLSKGLTNQGYFSGHRCMSTAFMFSEVRWRIPSYFTIIFNSLRNTMLSIAKFFGGSNGSAVSAGTYLTALF